MTSSLEEAPSPHEVRLVLLDTNPVFQSLGGKFGFFWIYLFLLILVFVLQLLSLHWGILIMLLSQNRMPCFIA